MIRLAPLLSALFFLAALSLGAAPAARGQELRVGIYQYRPLCYSTPGGPAQGIYPEILDALAQELGWDLTYVPGTFSQCLRRLEQGEIDVLMGIAFSTERAKRFNFNRETVIATWGQIYTKHRAGINTVLDLAGRTVALLADDIYNQDFRDLAGDFMVDCQFVERDEYQEVIALANAGKVDAAVADRIYAAHAINLTALVPTPIIFGNHELRFAFSPNVPALVIRELDQGLARLKADKTSAYHRALSRWLAAKPLERVPAWVAWLVAWVGGLMLVAGGAALWQRRQVRHKTAQLAANLAELENTQLALQRSEHDYRTLVDNASVGIFRSQPDPGGRLLQANPAMARMLGYSSVSHLLTAPVRDLFPSASAMQEILRTLASQGEVRARDLTYRRADGSAMWGRLTAMAGFEHDGRVGWFEGVLEDITQRKQAELALGESEERYRKLVENVPYGLFIAAVPSGRLIYLNAHIKEIFGYGPETRPGDFTVWDVTAPEDHPRIRGRLRRRMAGENIDQATVYTGVRKDGSRFTYEAAISVVSHQGAKALQGFLRDVTRVKMLERQLQHAQKMEAVGTLAGGVAHEFNNILMAIRGYTQLLAALPGMEGPAGRYLGKIEDGTQRAASLTKAMLSFSHQHTGEMGAVDVVRMLRDVSGLLRQTLPGHIRLETFCPQALPLIRADRQQLEQVLINLAINARDAMPDGGNLRLSALLRLSSREFQDQHPWAKAKSYLVLEVRDDGFGMTPEVRSRIFEPFFTTKEPGQGTGLGLSMAYSMVQAHGGEIEVESAPDQGTRFQLFIPALPPEEAPEAGSQGQDSTDQGQGRRVLVVDDKQAVREVAKEALEMMGYQVAEACDGRQALEAYRQAGDQGEEVELVILDLSMPVMDGATCLDELLKLDPAAKVIIATGHPRDNQEVSRLAGRTAGVLRKPFDLRTMLAMVEKALAERT